MSKMADLKGVLARLDSLLDRADALTLTEEQSGGLEFIRNNGNLIRADLDDLLATVPEGYALEDMPPPDPREQGALDASVRMLSELCNILQAWLEEWGA